jgi:outer membrane PBP1 activator LpoA protein
MATSLRRAGLRNEIHLPARFTAWLVTSLVAALLAACQPVQYPDYERERVSTAGKNAAEMSDQGRHQDSADAYMQLAQRAGGIERQLYLILVANERRLAGYPEVAQTILDRLGTPIAEANLLLWVQVAAEVAIAVGDPDKALVRLNQVPPTADASAAANILLIKSNALFRVGRPVDATKALIEREIWLEDRASIIANQNALWESYQNWGADLTEQISQAKDDPLLLGWLELGVIAWTRGNNSGSMRRALVGWQSGHPGHPANGALVPGILDELPAIREFPRQIALLLPLSGRQKLSANAVRDGFLAAHFSATDQEIRPVILVYDVSSSSVSNTYAKAVQNSADFVVGPLLKESVGELAQANISVPTLTLNFLPDQNGVSPAFYQFALSPEDEARQVAQRAASLGQLRALAIAPDNAWGRRLFNGFATEFASGGGQILRYQFYDPDGMDFSYSIQELLLIDESQARRDRLAANLAIELEFEPRRRADIDLIFLAATANAGKLIRPQLRFHYAGSIPTYSTSAIYQEGTRNNSDLNGIMFPDIPWIIAPDGQSIELRKTLAKHWTIQAERRSRLFAMGFDAYRLIPMLNSGDSSTSEELQGMTGILTLDEQSRVIRNLPWARIHRGRPELMDPLPEQQAYPTNSVGDGEWLNTSDPAERPNE